MLDIRKVELKVTEREYSLNYFRLTINIINLLNNQDSFSIETQYLNYNLFFIQLYMRKLNNVLC